MYPSATPLRWITGVFVFSLGLSSGFPLRAADESPLEGAWRLASKLLIAEARTEFERTAARDDGDALEAKFGLATVLLSTQPKTEGNIDEAARLFDEVAAADSGDLGIAALFHRARIEQIHRFEPDRDRGAVLFADLAAKHPGHPLADEAIVKRAIIELYEEMTPEDRRTRIEEFASLSPAMGFGPARRDLHLVLADASARYLRDDELTLNQLLSADEIGIARRETRAGHWVRIGRLAEATGRSDVAVDYYARFVRDFPRDSRHFMIAQTLDQLRREGVP